PADDLVKVDHWLPAQEPAGFRRIRKNATRLQWPDEFGVTNHAFLPVATNAAIGDLAEFPERMHLPRPYHELVRGVLLQDAPHGLHEIRRISPVARHIEVSQGELAPLDDWPSA